MSNAFAFSGVSKTQVLGWGYRYTFNGMEEDDELKNDGNSLDFGARIYDPRIGRWLSRDPKENKYPDLSPYNFVANSPLKYIDPNGEEIKPVDDNSDRLFLADISNFKSGLRFRDKDYNSMSGQDFFGVVPYHNGGISGSMTGGGANVNVPGHTLTTQLTQKQINERVRSIKGRADRKQARAIFDLLSSEHIYQIRYLSNDAPTTGSPSTFQPLPEGGNLNNIENTRRKAFNNTSDPANAEIINDATNTQILREGLSLAGGNASFVSMSGWDFLTPSERRASKNAKNVGTINILQSSSISVVAEAMVDAGLVVKKEKTKKEKVRSDITP